MLMQQDHLIQNLKNYLQNWEYNIPIILKQKTREAQASRVFCLKVKSLPAGRQAG
jgi:hypothetical protein